MCDDYRNYSLNQLLRMAKAASSGSEARRRIAREILKQKELRAELFQLANSNNLKQRLKSRNDIVWLMQESGNITACNSTIGLEVYQEALARTWEWFGRNFEKYQPARASFVTWFNIKLRFTIIDVQYEVNEENKRKQSPFSDKETGEVIDPINLLSDIRQDPELAAEFSHLVEQLRKWLQQQKRPLSRKVISQHSSANCYDILLQYLPQRDSETELWRMGNTFTEIADSLEVPLSDIMRCFRDKCWPAMKSFAQSQGLY